MTALLSIRGVKTFYGNIQALKGIDLDVNEGEIVTLIGANGAGKSTLLMTICGTPRARHGSIVFEGEDITQKPTFEIMRKGIAQSPEGRRIFPRMSVVENLKMGAFTRRDKDAIQKDLDHCFALFPILAERKNQTGGTLSGGEQQMLAIARALMARPKVLLLDEPSLGLAPIVCHTIFTTIDEIKAAGTTVLLVEQNANAALKHSDRGYVLETGAVTLEGSAAEIAGDPRIREAYLGE
jgi:branched-chain amino acid transport system ATP-binding protein